jgi:hypothetical protein
VTGWSVALGLAIYFAGIALGVFIGYDLGWWGANGDD